MPRSRSLPRRWDARYADRVPWRTVQRADWCHRDGGSDPHFEGDGHASPTPRLASPTAAPTFSVRTSRCPPARVRTTWRRLLMAASGTRPRAAGSSGWLDPANGNVREIALGPARAARRHRRARRGAWITDGGLNAIVRVDPETERSGLPATRLGAGRQPEHGGLRWRWRALVHRTDRLVRAPGSGSGEMEVFAAPRGWGPYGITATPDGEIYYSSLAGSYLGAVDRASGEVRAIDPPTAGAGAARTWADSTGGSGSASGMRGRSAATTRRTTPGRSGRCRSRAAGLRGLRRRHRCRPG